MRFTRVALLLLVAGSGSAAAQSSPALARYDLEVVDVAPPRIRVRATLPCDGSSLGMATSRPSDVPEIAETGWPGLVRDLSISDDEGRPIEITGSTPAGWTLAQSVRGSITLRYEVDYAPLERRHWPAHRESAYAESDRFVVIGRSLFVTTPTQESAEVRFALPRGWQPVLPWSGRTDDDFLAVVDSTQDLTQNLLAFQRGSPDRIDIDGFALKILAFGPWQAVRGEVHDTLAATLRHFVAWVGFEGETDYLIVLMPRAEDAGEAFRESFALDSEQAPSRTNLVDWGNTLAHEVFHFWNGGRLRGADGPASQWFLEGVTEYAANLALVASGLVAPDDFYAKLSRHVTDSRRLDTPLERPGASKGPPLYGAGALVAFDWDVTLRARTHGARGLGDVLRELLRRTGEGSRNYVWADIEAALESVGPGDWNDFHRRYIQGSEPLPLEPLLARVGLVLSEDEAGVARVSEEATATAGARSLRRAVLRSGR